MVAIFSLRKNGNFLLPYSMPGLELVAHFYCIILVSAHCFFGFNGNGFVCLQFFFICLLKRLADGLNPKKNFKTLLSFLLRLFLKIIGMIHFSDVPRFRIEL